MKINEKLNITAEQKNKLVDLSKKNSDRFKLILDIYKDFSDFLEEIKVPHVFWAGSALGAHLYEDFIPGDDDIDIAIPHNTRGKIISEFSKHMDKKYKLVCHETGPGCFPFMKVINTDIEIDSPNSDLPKYSRYLGIDITSVTPTKKKTIPFGIRFGGHLLFARNATQGTLINILKTPLKLIPQKLITGNMNRIMSKQEDGDFSLELIQFHKGTTAKIDFNKLIFLNFHEIKIPVTEDYMNHLKSEFRNYNIYEVPKKIHFHNYKIKGLDY